MAVSWLVSIGKEFGFYRALKHALRRARINGTGSLVLLSTALLAFIR